MGRFMDWLRGPERKAASDDIAAVSDPLTDAIKWGLLDGSYGTMYRKQPAVFTVVNKLAWGGSGVKLKVYERVSDTDRVELGTSELARFLRNPAPGLTYRRWMFALIADFYVYGNWLHEKLQRADTRLMQPLPVYTVTPKGGSLVQPGRYEVSNGEQRDPRTIDAEDMFHGRLYNPSDLRWGVSPLEPLRLILNGESDALESNYDMWRNSARIRGVIESQPDAPVMTEDQQEEFRAHWQSTFAGGGNSGKTPVLPPGKQFKEATFSPKEAEFIEGRRLTLETTGRALGVDPQVLGLTGTATYASQKEFHRAFYVDTLGPLFGFIEAEVMEQIVPWFTSDEAVYVEFHVAEKLRLSFEEQAAALRQAVGAPFMSVNRANAILNEPSFDDPAFDEPVKPTNIIYAGQEGEAPMPEERERPLRAASVTDIGKKEGTG